MFEYNPRRFNLLILIFVIFFSLAAKSQEIPVYNQFFLNPYIINPAYAGYENQTVIYFSHRQQWAGIEGAPATSFVSFHTPLKNRLSFGTNIINDERGLINTSSADFTLAYTLPTYKEQYIRFGLSGGVGMNSLDLDEVDNPNDPAILNVSDNNFYTSAQFGVNYFINGLNIGMAFPGLLDNNIFNKQDFSRPEFRPLEKLIVMANYRLQLTGDKLSLEPHILYRQFGNASSQLELLSVLHIRDIVWIGGSYKSDYGFSALAGLNYKEKFNFGYAYEIASSQVNGFSGGTHEFVFGIKIGKKKKPEYKRLVKQEKMPEKVIIEEKPIKAIEQEEDTTEMKKEPEQELEKEQVITDNERYETISKDDHPLALPSGHHVIVGAFSEQENALTHIQQLKEKGVISIYGYSAEKELYYVYVTSTLKLEEAIRQRNKIRQRKIYQFEDAWILTVE